MQELSGCGESGAGAHIAARPQHRFPVDAEHYGLYEPSWKRERLARRQAKLRAKAAGLKWPKLRTICRVDLDQIYVPGWAREKAIAGLTLTSESVWLGRIAAAALARLDREAGGTPIVTKTLYRRCPLCDRPLLGEEAQARFDLDRTMTGRQVPCGPECLEVSKTKRGR